MLEKIYLSICFSYEEPKNHCELQHYEVVYKETHPVGFWIQAIDLEERLYLLLLFHSEDIKHDRKAKAKTDWKKRCASDSQDGVYDLIDVVPINGLTDHGDDVYKVILEYVLIMHVGDQVEDSDRTFCRKHSWG